MIRILHQYYYDQSMLIGQGQWSQVYKGYSFDKSAVAIKVVDRNTLNKTSLHLLQNEISILQNLDSPYIVKLIDIQNIQNITYIIMEYCQDGTLEAYLNKNTLIKDELQFTKYAEQLIEALYLLKQIRVIHNDIKPANILIHQDFLKLADFGFAIFENTNLPVNIGSPYYMSPEKLLNNSQTFSSDMWALGITFYQMLHGYIPFKANNNEQLLYQLRNNKIIIKNTLNSKTNQILRQMLEQESKKRIEIEELRQLIKNEEQFNNLQITQKYQNLQKDNQEIMNRITIKKRYSMDVIVQQQKDRNEVIMVIQESIQWGQLIQNLKKMQQSREIKELVDLFEKLILMVMEDEKVVDQMKNKEDKQLMNLFEVMQQQVGIHNQSLGMIICLRQMNQEGNIRRKIWELSRKVKDQLEETINEQLKQKKMLQYSLFQHMKVYEYLYRSIIMITRIQQKCQIDKQESSQNRYMCFKECFNNIYK